MFGMMTAMVLVLLSTRETSLSPTGRISATFHVFAGTFTKPPAIVFADRKSTRLNSSHLVISYAVFCLKKKIGAKAQAVPLLIPLNVRINRSWRHSRRLPPIDGHGAHVDEWPMLHLVPHDATSGFVPA